MTSITTALPARFAPRDDEALSDRIRLLGLSRPATRAPLETGVLARIRAICPQRALSWAEAERVAERQAGILRRELGLNDRPAIPTAVLVDLPFLTVTYEIGSQRQAWQRRPASAG
jgi:hypothetical protein